MALDFSFEERDFLAANLTHDPIRTFIGPFLASMHQPQNIHLKNCSITLENLQTFVPLTRKKPGVLGLWYVYLLDGDWADAVEVLRSEVLHGELSQQSVSNLVTFIIFSLFARHPYSYYIHCFQLKCFGWCRLATQVIKRSDHTRHLSCTVFLLWGGANSEPVVCDVCVRCRVLNHVDGREEGNFPLQVWSASLQGLHGQLSHQGA